jgi:hypothetical protein
VLCNLLYRRLGRAYLERPASVGLEALTVVGTVRDRLWAVQMAAWLLVLLATLVWTHRAYGNLSRRGTPLHLTARQAVWAWLPVVNVVQAPRVVADLRRASMPRASSRHAILPIALRWVVLSNLWSATFLVTVSTSTWRILTEYRYSPPHVTMSQYFESGIRQETITHAMWGATEGLGLMLAASIGAAIAAGDPRAPAPWRGRIFGPSYNTIAGALVATLAVTYVIALLRPIVEMLPEPPTCPQPSRPAEVVVISTFPATSRVRPAATSQPRQGSGIVSAPWVLTSRYVLRETSHRSPDVTAPPGRWSSTAASSRSSVYTTATCVAPTGDILSMRTRIRDAIAFVDS